MVLGTCSPLAFVLSLWKWHISDALTTFESPPKSMQIWLCQWFLFLRSHHFGTSRTLRKSNVSRFSGCFLVTFLVHQFGRNSPRHFGTGGGQARKNGVVFGVFWGEGQMIQISLNSTDGNLDSNYMYIIFVYIHIQKIFRWIVGQRSRNAVALYSMFEFRGVFASGAEKRYLCAPLQWDRWPSPSQPPGSPTAPWRWDKFGAWVKILVDRFLWSGVLPGDVGIIEIGLYFVSFFETKGIAYIDEPRLFTTHQLWSEDVCVRESWTWPWYQFNV